MLNEFPCKYQRRMVYDNQRWKTRRASFVLLFVPYFIQAALSEACIFLQRSIPCG